MKKEGALIPEGNIRFRNSKGQNDPNANKHKLLDKKMVRIIKILSSQNITGGIN